MKERERGEKTGKKLGWKLSSSTTSESAPPLIGNDDAGDGVQSTSTRANTQDGVWAAQSQQETRAGKRAHGLGEAGQVSPQSDPGLRRKLISPGCSLEGERVPPNPHVKAQTLWPWGRRSL